MLLTDKTVVVYAAGGAIGGAVARAFAREGARVYLTGRHLESVQRVAKEIVASGGSAEAAQLDALDESAVERHLDGVIAQAGQVDVSFNAIGIPQQGIQGIPLTELSVESFSLPVTTYARSQFVTARAAARRMLAQGSGVILMHTPEPARLGAPLVGGMGPAWAAMEGLSRGLSAELGSHGVRVVCLRTTGIPETATIDVVFGLHAKTIGISREQFQSLIEDRTHRRRSTTLAELANVAAFVASDKASAMTGTVANLTGGAIVD
ncbi:MAG TPA: SDR family oxidoreductase [Vicinamibacterales bacterium]|nr:SDR family oxidoreductase [Vicinamibacterales bacterium]